MQHFDRYNRQMILPGIGTTGQQKLQDARILVVGAGGLGCPVLQYLTAAGIGTIGIIDHDTVSLSNLHRQVLYTTANVGQPKATTAAAHLQQLNPATQFITYNQKLTNQNACDIISLYHVVVDGSDNFATRYLVNDACVLLGKPLVYGSVFQFEGQVAVFNYQGSLHYRHLFASPPAAGEVPDCSEAGVLGILPGIIGSLMANEVLKVVLQLGSLLVNKVLTYQSLYNSFFEFQLQANNEATLIAPQNRQAFEQMDYGSSPLPGSIIREVDQREFEALLNDKIPCIDVREPGELPFVGWFAHSQHALSSIQKDNFTLPHQQVILFCKSGVRSKQAAEIIAGRQQGITVFCLAGGIDGLKHMH